MTSAKVQEELDTTVGQTHAPRLEDVPSCTTPMRCCMRSSTFSVCYHWGCLTRDVNLRNHFLHRCTGSLEFCTGEGDNSEIRFSEGSPPRLLLSL